MICFLSAWRKCIPASDRIVLKRRCYEHQTKRKARSEKATGLFVCPHSVKETMCIWLKPIAKKEGKHEVQFHESKAKDNGKS